MNAKFNCSIKKSPHLFQLLSSMFQKKSFKNKELICDERSTWMIYGRDLMRFHAFDKKAFLCFDCEPLMAWSVGDYDVCLMKGRLTPAFYALSDEFEFDLAFCENLPQLSKPGIALFDMDSTAIQIECIDEIAKRIGVGAQVAAITERAMQGELDFEDSLRSRVKILKGTPVKILDEIRSTIPYMSGMHHLTTTLQDWGWKVAIASGGFTCFSDQVKQDLKLDFACSNQLVIENGFLTGELEGTIVDGQQKAAILLELAKRYHIPLSNTIAVGDGANDLAMMAQAGLGIAYHAKPSVQASAQVAIRHADLIGVMCVLSASLVPNIE